MKKGVFIVAGVSIAFLCILAGLIMLRNRGNDKVFLNTQSPVIEAGALLKRPVYYKPVANLDAELKLTYSADDGKLYVMHTVKNQGKQNMQFEYAVVLKNQGKKIASGKADPSYYQGLMTVDPGMFVNAGIVSLDLAPELASKQIELEVQFSERSSP